MTNNQLLYATLDRVVAANSVGTWNQNVWIEHESVSPTRLEVWRDRGDTEARLAIERAQKRYDATDDMCGTSMCFAGHTLMQAGGVINAQGDGIILDGVEYGEFGDGNSISEKAAELLDLEAEEEELLFEGSNSLETLKHLVDRIAQ